MFLSQWYEVRYLEPGKDGLINHGYKSFQDKDKAEQFFNELGDVFTKQLILCEKTVKQKVLLSTL